MLLNAQHLTHGLSDASRSEPVAPRLKRQIDARWYRNITIGLLAAAVLAPVGLIVYQSFLDGPFFSRRSSFGLDAYVYVLTDPTFHQALGTTVLFALGMVVVAVPLGGILAFLLTRTDIRFKKTLEILVLVPMFISSIVLAFGYTVAAGPSGFSTRCPASSCSPASATCRTSISTFRPR